MYYSWLFVILIEIKISLICAEKDTAYLTDHRETQIRFLFSHNVPFEDMRHLESRAQRMGIRSGTRFQDRTAVPVFRSIRANFTGIIEDYFQAAFLLYKKKSTKTEVPTLVATLQSNLKTKKFDEDFLWYIFLNNPETLLEAHYAQFYKTFPAEPILETYKYPGPFFMHVIKSWKLFFMLELSSSHDWVHNSEKPWPQRFAGELSKIHDEWSLLFVDEICRAFHRYRHMKLTVPNGLCPDPCITQPCFNIPNTASSTCVATGTKWDEFSCTCQPRYSWIKPPKSAGHCQMNDYCFQYCNMEGTRRCDVIDQKEFCVCRPTHMGPTCHKKRDPCVELSSPTEIPGNVACNVNHGGKCVGTIGTNTYYCICPPAYISDPSYPLPNCLAFKDRCLSIICVHGDCISSKDGQEVYCSCSDEAYGEHCELSRGRWAQWSPWSECTPACGVAQYQRRVRTRDCLGEACRGGDGHLQTEMCETMPCPDETLALSQQGRSEEIGELNVQMLQAQAARCVKLVGAVAEALVAISCVFAALAATAMAISVHLMS
ncbi:hypothetical protein D915_002154 [Fasciola hepatica]|uniref:EGF-like domain-containing protein n=1 Tax=Fasciola hepatica TaxID=6192 RepID=A0A4E0RMR4_FASHE|nr:hypothetical protein D915_002154 [Fasciola hepatica]